ncbi:MAG: DUF58 domain-containing protein [Actinomycetota bacterium]
MAASTAQAGWLFVLAAGVLGLVGASLITRQNLDSATIVRSAPRRARVGDDVRVGITVHSGKRSLPLLRLEDRFDAFEPTVVASNRLRKYESSELELVKHAHRRGVFESGTVMLRSGSPFGFTTTSRTIDVQSPVTVVPHHVELRSFPILEPSSSPSDVLHERARTGAGQEYLGVREYRPGDPPRSVHWRSTARAGRLVVREYEEEVQTRVTLVVGGADVGEPPDSPFEMLVSAAASIALYALVTGHPVDMVRHDDNGEIEQLADPDRFAVLDWLAAATPRDEPLGPLVERALGRVGRRGTIVLLTSTVGAAMAGLDDSIRLVQTAGSRAIAVVAQAGTWLDDKQTTDADALGRITGGRAVVMPMSRRQELTECLG